jgi:hypothetical protein
MLANKNLVCQQEMINERLYRMNGFACRQFGAITNALAEKTVFATLTVCGERLSKPFRNKKPMTLQKIEGFHKPDAIHL